MICSTSCPSAWVSLSTNPWPLRLASNAASVRLSALIRLRMPRASLGRRPVRLDRSWNRKRYWAMRSTIRCRNSQ
ncbi:hypothetical protein D3C81_2067590 [compost metagenome]